MWTGTVIVSEFPTFRNLSSLIEFLPVRIYESIHERCFLATWDYLEINAFHFGQQIVPADVTLQINYRRINAHLFCDRSRNDIEVGRFTNINL